MAAAAGTAAGQPLPPDPLTFFYRWPRVGGGRAARPRVCKCWRKSSLAFLESRRVPALTPSPMGISRSTPVVHPTRRSSMVRSFNSSLLPCPPSPTRRAIQDRALLHPTESLNLKLLEKLLIPIVRCLCYLSLASC
jgi:hypothetical protein